MNAVRESITSRLISEEAIKEKLPSIFVDSLIVDQKFNIVVVSQNVLQFLEFTASELKGKNINYLAGRNDIVFTLKEELKVGYFEELRTSFYTKNSRSINIGISGFYLGLISDMNGYIVLKVRDLDEVEVVNNQLQLKKAELDKFIYRASHDLRGPLATIKGLVNLLKISQVNGDVAHLVQLIDAHANKLDERLFQLMYLAHSDQSENAPKNTIFFPALETALRKVAEQNAFLDFLELHFFSPEMEINDIDETLVEAMLTNLLLHFLALPKSTMQNQAFFRFHTEDKKLIITIGTVGFEMNHQLRNAIDQPDSIYTDVINYPQLINFYAAQKVAWKLNAKIKFQFISDGKQRLTISIPFQERSQLPLFSEGK